MDISWFAKLMKTPLRLRLTFSHLLVSLIGMILAGTLAWTAVENLYISTQRDNLLSQASLTALALEGSDLPSFSQQPYSQTTNVSPGIHKRLLSESGAVIIGVPLPEGEDPIQVPPSLDPGFVPAEDLVSRPEIQEALSGQASTAVRRIKTLDGQRVLYAAAPVWGPDNQVTNLVYLATPLPPRGLPGDLILKLTGAILAGGIFASLIGILLARTFSRPLEDLDRAAGAVSQGCLDQQVPAHSSIRELATLGQSFNQMTESLQRSDELKNAFIADVTHELRTPLTVLKGTVETLEDGALDDREGRTKLLGSMKRETERLIRLVNQLLVLARMDAGALMLDLRELDLEDLVRERAANLTPLAAQKQVGITIQGQGKHLPKIIADRSRTAQVIDNLLDNALRYAPPGSEVTVQLEVQQGWITCSIEDTGPGITSAELPKIFDRFYRVEPSRDRTSGGSGLGLSIAKALVEAQGGTIHASSQVGKGTRLTFKMPSHKLPPS